MRSQFRHRIKVVGYFDYTSATQKEKYLYAMHLFSGAIKLIETCWNDTGQLPGEGMGYLEGLDFDLNGTSVDWVNYKLVLS